MDIGTNTELILGNKHRILAASCPAGPAFEGGAIACGMPGLDGAIEDVAHRRRRHVRSSASSATSRPQGICGSGLVDLMSELLRTGRMNEMGRFEDGARSHRRSTRRTTSTSSKATSTSWRRPRARTSPGCRSCSASTASPSTTSTCSISPAASAGTEDRRVAAHRADPEYSRREDRAGRQRGHRRRVHRAAVDDEARASSKQLVQARRALPAGNASAVLRFLRRRLPVQAGRIRRAAESARRMIELVDTLPDTSTCSRPNTSGCSAIRAATMLDERARELADVGTRLVRRARPAVGLRARRPTRSRSTTARSCIDGVALHQHAAAEDARATPAPHGAMLVAVERRARSSRPRRSSCGRTRSPTNISSSRSTARRSSSI